METPTRCPLQKVEKRERGYRPAGKSRRQPQGKQRGKSGGDNDGIDQPIHQQRLRMAFESWPEQRQKRVIGRWVIQIIRRAGELKRLRVEQPQRRQSRRQVAGGLDLCDIGGMRDFVEALRHVLACCAEQRGQHKQAENDRGDEIICRAGRGRQRAGRGIGRVAGHGQHKCTGRG